MREAIELFAGVGGFRLGLERSGWDVVWSNQWEPSTKKQHASEVYTRHFGSEGHVNMDIADVDAHDIPDHSLLAAGFPCQDYSVARTLGDAAGLAGQKGILWWDIHRVLMAKRPRFVLLENVDRLLSSPAKQRGRDFHMILTSLMGLGYSVEWQVVDPSAYGFPQKRKRLFMVGDLLHLGGDYLKRAFPITIRSFDLLHFESHSWGKVSPFQDSGACKDGIFATYSTIPRGPNDGTLGDVLQSQVDERFYIDDLERWKYLKGAKKEERTHKSGSTYMYSEGAIAFPDPVDRPSRTVITGEGGSSPSRFKHVVKQDGRHRRLTPIELERLNGFPDDWTDGYSDSRRAFLMGNALVVGVVERIGAVLLPDSMPGNP